MDFVFPKLTKIPRQNLNGNVPKDMYGRQYLKVLKKVHGVNYVLMKKDGLKEKDNSKINKELSNLKPSITVE